MYGMPPVPEESRRDVHWAVELDDAAYQGLLKWMRTTGKSYGTWSAAALEQFEAAEQRPGPLPPLVDWSALEARERQGYSIADQIYDGLPKKKGKPS